LDVHQRNKYLLALAVFNFYRRYPSCASDISEPLVDLVFSEIMNKRLDRLPCGWKGSEKNKEDCKKKCSRSISVKVRILKKDVWFLA